MTVSRALSNHPGVREETRKKILTRAEELGYVRSTAASAMRGGATGIVGLLLPGIANEFYARFANAFALECEARGQHLFIRLTNDDPAREAASLAQLRALQADAVVMVPTPGAATPETRALLSGFEVVQLIRYRAEIADAGRVLLDDARPIADAVHHLVRAGHDRIGYIGASASLSSGATRLTAFRAALAGAGVTADEDLIRTAHPSFAGGRQGLAAILDRPHPASAAICGGFELSNGALDEVMRRNLSMPGDLAFIGYGDPAFYKWIAGGIATVSLPVDDLARRAAMMVAPGAESAGQHEMLPADLCIRASAGP